MSYYTNLSKKDVVLDIASATASSKTHPWPVFLFLVTMVASLALGLWLVITGDNAGNDARQISGVAVIIVGVIVSIMWLACLRVADQWDRVIVLRLGKLHSACASRGCSSSCRSSTPWRSGSTPACRPPT